MYRQLNEVADSNYILTLALKKHINSLSPRERVGVREKQLKNATITNTLTHPDFNLLSCHPRNASIGDPATLIPKTTKQ